MSQPGGRLQRLERLAAARQRARAERLRAARTREDDLRRAAERATQMAGQRLMSARTTDLTADLAAWTAERRVLIGARQDARHSALQLEGAALEAERCRAVYLRARGETEALRRLSLRRVADWRQMRVLVEVRTLDDLAGMRAALAAPRGGGGPH